MKIRNREELLSHGDVESRRIILDITEKTLEYLDGKERIKSIARMDGDFFCVGEKAIYLALPSIGQFFSVGNNRLLRQLFQIINCLSCNT